MGNYFLGDLIRIPLYHVLIAAFGTIVFLAWVLFDTSRLIHRDDPELTPALAAFELILDIVGLHRWLLDLLKELDLFSDWLDFGD